MLYKNIEPFLNATTRTCGVELCITGYCMYMHTSIRWVSCKIMVKLF